VKKDYWDVTDDQVTEKTGKPLAHWNRTLARFEAEKKKSGEFAGFTLHAATRAGALDLFGREALLRYSLRPSLAQERLKQRPDGVVRINLKKAYRYGTVAVDSIRGISVVRGRRHASRLVLHRAAQHLRVSGGRRGRVGGRARERAGEEGRQDIGRRLLGSRRTASAAHHLR
jgi:hypothetical protein